ncbi:hypothetical protein AN931_05600 [Mycobacterium intracellulare subsp. chimaera]|nr:hypothetical protein AN480_06900 [Mycobacterium intracellulare subsp. chimaera]KPN47587.1 hypothetical protein AN932_20985 [Mycobacterium intracellulare subsp. chimaera]KPN58132.1 hypothetical protein AN933_05340 [Mycobacterium intracellulare subsp. chimaera]KPN59991.1 hypothetical protein AN931_05600 [Mycobacterium intracellulare subsp. chimaera]ORV24451.1 hypothetical protein AWB97_20415 [Mycobacterium intracellulare subsp. chimaera]
MYARDLVFQGEILPTFLVAKTLTILGGAALLVSAVGCDDGVVATSAGPPITMTAASFGGAPAQPLPASPESRAGGAGFTGCIIGLNCGCFPRQGKCGRQRSPRVVPPPPPPGEFGNNGPADDRHVPVVP